MSNKINFWYIVIALSSICVLLWFFISLNKSPIDDTSLKIAKSYTNPLEKEFDQKAIDELNSRLIIDIRNLDLIPTYTAVVSNQNSSNTRQVGGGTDNLNRAASSSANLNLLNNSKTATGSAQ
jgi:hypothetical protein